MTFENIPVANILYIISNTIIISKFIKIKLQFYIHWCLFVIELILKNKIVLDVLTEILKTTIIYLSNYSKLAVR